jgi:internalin A
MMESCGICFKARRLSDEEWEYIAPELLPEWAGAQEQLLGRLRDEPPTSERVARYPFLHEGILRSYLSRLGGYAKDAAVYWKYGCWFYEQKTRTQVLIKSSWDDPASETGPGTIVLRAWGQGANDVVEILLQELRNLSTGQAPKISDTIRPGAHALSTSSASIEPSVMRIPHIGERTEGGDNTENPLLDQLQMTSRPELLSKSTPEIFVSYAWCGDSSEDARKRTEVVDRLCETFDKDGWHILRDKTDMRPGDLISGFMKRIGLADHVIVVLSDKYLRSTYCMTELHSIYQRSVGEKEGFLRRIIPLVLADARFGTPEERVEYAKHWEARYLKLKSELDHLSVEDFRRYKLMQKWHLDIGEMLTYVSDVLSPHGFDDIVKADFSGLRQMLATRQ